MIFKHTKRIGSALILVVVLTSILAIVGSLFIISARIDELSTKSINQEKDLDAAVESIVAILANELVLDTPGVDNQEYYDYPDVNNMWLANLEPYSEDTDNNPATLPDFYWSQISDLTGYIGRNIPGVKGSWNTQNISLVTAGNSLMRAVVPDYRTIELDVQSNLVEQMADADGDGIADSKWFELENVSSSTGKKLYAALRVIDNGGMLNINTAYMFDDGAVNQSYIDGSRLSQVNLMNVVKSGNDPNNIHITRCGGDNPDLVNFNYEYAIRPENPDRTTVNYLPYDISDELDLRNRFLLDIKDNICRIEQATPSALRYPYQHNRFAPIDRNADFQHADVNDWTDMMNRDSADNCYDFRHLLTSYNTDRIITPYSDIEMVNINRSVSGLDSVSGNYSELLSWTDANSIYDAFIRCIDSSAGVAARRRMKRKLAQLAVNMVDLRDNETDVTSLSLDYADSDNEDDFSGSGEYIYGIEPFPVITQVAIAINAQNPFSNSYGVELYNPFSQDIDLANFSLMLSDGTDPNLWPVEIPLNSVTLAAGGFYVVSNDPCNVLNVIGSEQSEAGLVLAEYNVIPNPTPPPDVTYTLRSTRNVAIRRNITRRQDSTTTDSADIFLDRHIISDSLADWAGIEQERYSSRNFDFENAVWWTDVVFQQNAESINSPFTLGDGDFAGPLTPRPPIDIILPYAYNINLVTVGDVARIWTIGPTDELLSQNSMDPMDPAGSVKNNYSIGEKLRYASENLEEIIRLNLEDPYYVNLFQYITVFDPRVDGIDNNGDGYGITGQDPNEKKIYGRININTAPRFVIEQLPWMTGDIAKAIVAYRDKLQPDAIDQPDYSGNTGRYDAIQSELNDPYLFSSDIREDKGFASIGELNLVIDRNINDNYSIQKYALEGGPTDFPDLTYPDGAEDDFEERDLIFSRISNLVTVRSDVFTAYILVRLGIDGPQKRMIAILDRSGVYQGADKVKIIALHPVADPR